MIEIHPLPEDSAFVFLLFDKLGIRSRIFPLTTVSYFRQPDKIGLIDWGRVGQDYYSLFLKH